MRKYLVWAWVEQWPADRSCVFCSTMGEALKYEMQVLKTNQRNRTILEVRDFSDNHQEMTKEFKKINDECHIPCIDLREALV